MEIKLLDNKYIKNIDKLNWGVCEIKTSEKTQEEKEYCYSYHPTIESALKSAIKQELIKAEDMEHLEGIIKNIRGLYRGLGYKVD